MASKEKELEFGLKLASYKPFLIPFVALIFFVVSLGKVIVPNVRLAIEYNQEIKEVQEEIGRLNRKLTALKSLDEDGLRDDFDFLLTVLPGEKRPFYGTSALNWLIDQNKLELKGISFEPGLVSTESAKKAKTTKEGLEQMTYSVGVIGSLEEVMDFLRDLEMFAPLTEVESIKVDLTQNEMRVGLTVQLLNAPLPKTLGKAALVVDDLSEEERTYLGELRETVLVPGTDEDSLTGDPTGKDDLFD